jgi:hypothetical protein
MLEDETGKFFMWNPLYPSLTMGNGSRMWISKGLLNSAIVGRRPATAFRPVVASMMD